MFFLQDGCIDDRPEDGIVLRTMECSEYGTHPHFDFGTSQCALTHIVGGRHQAVSKTGGDIGADVGPCQYP